MEPPETPLFGTPTGFAEWLRGPRLRSAAALQPGPNSLFADRDAVNDLISPPPPRPKPPARPPIRDVELVIYDELRGWVTLGSWTGVDLRRPLELMVDAPFLPREIIGTLRFDEIPLASCTKIDVSFGIAPVPLPFRRERPFRTLSLEEIQAEREREREAAAQADGTSGGADEADETSGSAGEAGSEAIRASYRPAEQPRAALSTSWLKRMGENLNPISTAQAAGPEEDENRAEEINDPLREVRIARYKAQMARLREVDPGNRLLGPTVQTHDFTPSEKDIREVDEALNEALRRVDRPAEPAGAPRLATRPPLFVRPPGGSPYDIIVEFESERSFIEFRRSQGKSDAEIRTEIEQRAPRPPNTIESGKDPASTDRSPAPATSVAAEAARYGRSEQEYEELARDPAQGRNISDKTRQERRVGLDLEKRGELDGPIVRDPTGGAEFIERNGQKWDVKAFNSNFPTKIGGFMLSRSTTLIEDSFSKNENVILDTSNLKERDTEDLKTEVENRGWNNRVKWWP